MTTHRHRALLAGASVTAMPTEAGLDLDGRLISWLDVDDLEDGDHRVRLGLASGESILLTGLGATHDAFMAEVRAARGLVRRAALTVATGDPLVTFVSRDPSGPVDVHLFAKVLVIEPRRGPCTSVPLPLLTGVHRDGYTITLTGRGVEPVVVRAIGARTDEFLMHLERARRDLQAAVCTAYGGFDASLSGFEAPDGWALTRREAGSYWAALHQVATGAERGAQVSLLGGLTGEQLAIGLYTDGGAQAMVFALAPLGDRIAVEAATADDRATFVFRGLSVARLNAVLLLTSFRREALSLPEDELGRWAVAARVWTVVREARAALVARVVHDDGWERNVRAALNI